MNQMTLLDYLNANSKPFVPFFALTECAKRGSLMAGSKDRIRHAFSTLLLRSERIQFLKNEYGVSGYGGPSNKPCTIHHVNVSAKGHEVSYNDGNGVCHNVFFSYAELEQEIQRLIQEGEY